MRGLFSGVFLWGKESEVKFYMDLVDAYACVDIPMSEQRSGANPGIFNRGGANTF